MALTQVSSKGIKDATLLNEDVNASANIAGSKLADNSISLAKLEHGDSNNDGKFLRANNGADPSYETIAQPDLTNLSASNLTSGTIPDARFPATLPAVSAANLTNIPAANITGTLPAIDGSNLTGISASDHIIEGNTKAEVVDTGAGYFKVETDGVERFRVNDNGKLSTGGENSPDVDGGGLCLNTGSSDGIFFSCKNSDIAHGRTSLDETDTLFSMRKISGNNGGVDIRGYTDSASGDPAIRIFGVIDDGSNSSYCPVELRGARKNSGGNTGTSQMHGNRGVVRISNDGDVTVATFTGEGLCFGSDIETANALDDYEEGTYTPTITNGFASGLTYSEQYGFYRKIGTLVEFNFFFLIENTSNDTDGSHIKVSLPFTSDNTTGKRGHGHITYTNFTSMYPDNNSPQLYIYSSKALCYANGGNNFSCSNGANQANRYFIGGGVYHSAS